MVNLVLAVASSLLIGVVFKLAGTRNVDRSTLLATNYFVAAAIGAGLAANEQSVWGVGVVGLGLLVGCILIGSLYLFSRATDEAGLSVTMAVMRLGVSIPFLGSWLLWSEEPLPLQWVGFTLALAALVFITRRSAPLSADVRAGSTVILLLLVFLGGGIGDLSFKAFDHAFEASFGDHTFLTLVFGVAWAIGTAAALRPNHDRVDGSLARGVGYGVALGVVNYGSLLFLLAALKDLPGIVVFPTISVSLVVGGALLGTAVWRERLSATNWAGVALAALAVALLNLPG